MENETFSILLTAWLMLVVAIAAPGPNLVATASTALGHGRKAGLLVVAGVATGTFIWSLASAFGVAAVFTVFPPAFVALKLAGGSYLVYLGFRSLRAAWRNTPGAIRPDTRRLSPLASYARGLGICLMNPKSALFWASISVFVVSSKASPLTIIEFCIAAGLSSFTIYGLYAVLFSSHGAQALYRRATRWIEAAFGAFFFMVGVRLVTA
ncbi:LysE family translocator [Oricola indica]|jgi:threonine efflux protein|uniref:LysE family translocator n=1 Tax=Oricola indica TaxID=2872591 RepID=UPI001CBEBF1C|nr:LysE family translocator [Oricola indica]